MRYLQANIDNFKQLGKQMRTLWEKQLAISNYRQLLTQLDRQLESKLFDPLDIPLRWNLLEKLNNHL